MEGLNNRVREGREVETADVKPNNKITQKPEKLTPETKEKLNGYQDTYREKKNGLGEQSQEGKGHQKLESPLENEKRHETTKPDSRSVNEENDRQNVTSLDKWSLDKRQTDNADVKPKDKITQASKDLNPEERKKIEGFQDKNSGKLDDAGADLGHTENEHFESTYKLKPNEKYDANGYGYETDRLGRITKCGGSLRLEEGKRNTAHQIRAGGEYRLENDEGGHLIGRRFGGSEKIDNLVPMDSHVNHFEYKDLEDDCAAELGKGNTVDVQIKCRYSGDTTRPTDFIINYKVTDKNGFVRNETKRIHNQEGES